MAKVLDIGKNGMVRLDLGGATVTTALHAQVTVGMHLPLEVLESTGQLLLRIRDRKRRADPKRASVSISETPIVDPQAARRQLFQCLRQMPGVTRWASLPTARNRVPHLLRMLTPLDPLSDSGERIAAQIQERIENSGLFFERRLARCLEGPGHPSERSQPLPLGPGAAALPAATDRDMKAVVLQLLGDLGRAAKPLPPLLGMVEKAAAVLLGDIQAQQRHAVERRFPENDKPSARLVYTPPSGSAAQPNASPHNVLEAWRRVTGSAPPTSFDNTARRDFSAPLMEATHGRRRLLTTAEAMSRSLAHAVQQPPRGPEKTPRDVKHLIRAIRTYIRIPEANGAIGIPAAWRSLARLAGALVKNRRAPAPGGRPHRQQRLSAALARLIRREADRFDADLGILKRLQGKPFGEDMAKGPQDRVGGTAGETGQNFGFTIPMAGPDPPVRFHIYCPPRKRTDTPGIHQVAILLSLRPMGNVRAEVSLAPEGLRVTLRLTEENALQWVSQHQHILESALASLSPSVRVDAHRHAPGSSAAGEPPPWVHAGGNTRVNVDV